MIAFVAPVAAAAIARIDVERLGIDVDEHGHGAESPDGAGRGKKCVRRQNHFIAGADF